MPNIAKWLMYFLQFCSCIIPTISARPVLSKVVGPAKAGGPAHGDVLFQDDLVGEKRKGTIRNHKKDCRLPSLMV